MMTLLIAVCAAAAIILATPGDPGTRLRELSRGPDTNPVPSRNGRRTLGRDSGGVLWRILRGRGGDAEEKVEADRLRAISAVENCAHLLLVGMSPRAVMATLSRQDESLRAISRAMSLGEEPGQAITAHHGSLSPAAAEIFAGMAAVWTVSERSGARAADMILRYAAAQRDALDAVRERRIALAGPRSTVRVLSWLPLIGIGLGLLIGVDPAALLSGLPGQLSLGAGVLLYVLGRVWMIQMTRRAEQ